jgi:chemotaxis protein histidine kinase CheA
LIAGDERKTIPIRLTTHQRIDIRQNEELGMKSLFTSLSSYLETLEFQRQRVKTEATERFVRQETEQDVAEKTAREKAEREAAKKAEQERKKFEEKARKEKEAGELHYEGMLAQKEGKFDEAEQLFQQSLKIAIDLEDDQGKASILNQLAILSRDREAKEKAEREAAEKKATEKAAKEKAVKEAGELHYSGMLALKQGNFDEAESLFQQSLKIAIDLKDEQAKSNILHQLELLTQERLDRKKVEREVAENAAKEKAKREAAEKAAREKARREATEKAVREKAEREAAEKVAREKVERQAAEKAKREAVERSAREKTAKKGLLFSWWGRTILGGLLGYFIGLFNFPDFALLCTITGSLSGLLLAPHIYSVYIMIVCIVVFWPIFYWIGSSPSIDGYSDASIASVVFVVLSPIFAIGVRSWWENRQQPQKRGKSEKEASIKAKSTQINWRDWQFWVGIFLSVLIILLCILFLAWFFEDPCRPDDLLCIVQST